MKRWPVIVMVASTAVILASLGCSRASDAPSAPTLSPVATPPVVRSPGPELSVTDLKYLLIHHFGGVFVAEPVVLPREIRLEQAQNAMRVIRDNEEEFQAILQELGLEDSVTLADEQRLLVFDEKTKLNRVRLEPSGNAYAFELVIGGRNDRSEVKGTVSRRGTITVHSNEPSLGPLPVCLAGSTRIQTPNGDIQVRDLLSGTEVWTTDASGTRIAATIERLASSPVPEGHEMIDLVLDDGRTLTASPRHPLADGRILEELTTGEIVDGARVVSAKRVAYEETHTYDILPDGGTALYWADEILIGSTLSKSPVCGK